MKNIIIALVLFCGILGCTESHTCCQDTTTKQETALAQFPDNRYESHDSVLVAEYHAWREWLKTHPEGTYEEFVEDTE